MASQPNRFRGILTTYLMPHRALVGWLTVLLFATIGLQLVNPQIVRLFIDTARSAGDRDRVATVGFLFLGVAIAKQVLGIAARYLSERLAWTATNALREDLALHCLRLDVAFHNTRTALST